MWKTGCGTVGRVCAALAVMVCAGLAVAAQPAFTERPGELEFSGQVVVRPKQERRSDPVWAADDARARARLAGMVLKHYADTDEYIVLAPAVEVAGGGVGGGVAGRGVGDVAGNGAERGAAENRLIAELMASGDYEYAEPNWLCYPVAVPNDPLFGNQWQWPMVSAPAAWSLQTGSASMIVAICDSGVDPTHPDLSANRVSGYNSAQGRMESAGGAVNDINGHGTFCAGMAVARGNDGVGVTGAGWNLRLMPVRVTNNTSGSAFQDDILGGARVAITMGAKISSCSFTGVQGASVQTTGESVRAAGGLLVYAADNSSTNHSGWDHADVVVVGATDSGDNRAWFSSYGRGVDLFAPGDNVYSTLNGGGYGGGSGTSFSTPLVAGALGVVWSVNPNMPPAVVEQIVYSAADDKGAAGNDDTWGWGRLNLLRAVQGAQATLVPAAPVAVADSGVTYAGGTATIDVLANDTDANYDPLTLDWYQTTTAKGGTIGLSPQAGINGRPRLVYSSPANIVPGSDSFTYRVRDTGGLTSTATVNITVVATTGFRDPENPSNPKMGLRVKYFDATGATGLQDVSVLTPIAEEVVPRIAMTTTSGNVGGSGRSDSVAAVYEGYLNISSPEVYTLFVASDDGSRLSIGDSVLVDNDGVHGLIEKSGTIALKAGLHKVKVEYFESTGSASLWVSMSSPTQSKKIINGAWFYTTPCATDLNGDGVTDDGDFVIFASSYEAFVDTTGDFNGDGFTDDADFVIFAEGYEAFVCP